MKIICCYVKKLFDHINNPNLQNKCVSWDLCAVIKSFSIVLKFVEVHLKVSVIIG